MPITVRHDAGGGALARLAALSGLTGQQNIEADRQQRDRLQANQLAAQRDRQQEQIQAAAQRQSQAADDAAAKTALTFGLEKQVKEDAFNRELETIQAEAKARAEQWEYQYSAKARQDIARGNDALQRIAQMKAAGEIDATTAARMTHEVNLGMSGITSSRVPVSPDKLPDGMQPGASSFDEHGNFRIRNKDGEDRIEQPWYETLEGKQKIHDWDMEKEQLKQVSAIAKERRAAKQKLMTETIEPVLQEGKEVDWGIDIKRKVGSPRFRNATEANEILDQIYGPEQQGVPATGQPAGAQQEAAPLTTGTFDQIFEEQKKSLKYTKAEHGLPDRVAKAQAFLRRADEMNYSERGSLQMKRAILEALSIMDQYLKQGTQ